MQYKNKGKTVRNTYALVLILLRMTSAILSLLTGNYEVQSSYISIIVMSCILLLIVIGNIREKVVINDEGIRFTRLFSKKVRWEEITAIKSNKYSHIGFSIYKKGKMLKSYHIRGTESDGDIESYKKVIGNIVGKLRNNAETEIDPKAAAIADGDYDVFDVDAVVDERRNEIKGLGGYFSLVWIYMSLTFFEYPLHLLLLVTGRISVGNPLLYTIKIGLTTLMSVILLFTIVVMFMRKKIFSKTLIIFLIAEMVINICYDIASAVILGTTMTFLWWMMYPFYILLGNLFWIFAFIKYAELSYRMKNTFVK